MLKIAVITVSDRAFKGEYSDRSGPSVAALLQQAFPDADLACEIVPDEMERLRLCLESHLDRDYILTTGGTGLSPRDVTVEATRAVCEREIPGIAEWLRRESEQETPYAVFSRATCGSRGRTIIINLPGSVKGAVFCTRLLVKVMEHGQAMLRGEGH